MSSLASSDRDSSVDGESRLRHQHSASLDHGARSLIVPMWDSSDPDRCPPPLPLNPQSPLSSRAGTSAAIQSAHAALNERARESALVPSTRRVHDASPERALVKGATHRRMQSLQPSAVRDLSYIIEGTGSPHGSPTKSSDKHPRPETPVRSSMGSESRPNDRDSMSSSPTPGPSLTPIVRPIVRRPPPQSILGENTPPQSSTMLALQSMTSQSTPKEADAPLSNITNGSTAITKHSQSLDQLSNQILSLTNIATSLQKEMSQLSRRSRDNATDLLSLREATTTRDEDIRKSLRDLITNGGSDAGRRSSAKDPFGGFYLDNKPHNTSPSATRAYQLPRIPSPKSFTESIERASVSTPSLVGSEAPASVSLLEKIIRDMGTKDGQENLVRRLAEVSSQLSGMATSAKIDELVEQIKSQADQAIILGNPADSGRTRNFSFEDDQPASDLGVQRPRSGPVSHVMKNEARRNSEPSRGSELLNDDFIKIIRSVKDSVAQGGGLTAEVKALVRELRGEVLGMGREIGRRLEQQASRRGVEEHDTPSKDEVARVIDEGLEQMKDQLNHVLREHRRQSAASVNTQKTAVDYQEIYNAMRAALRDNEATRGDAPDLSRDDVIQAVKEAWENYKPEIEVQQLGLERDEVLDCLKQGLKDYAPRDDRPPAASRDEVFTAVVEGLKHFVPPQVDTPESVSRDEIIDAVRDCLEEFEFPVVGAANSNELTHEDMVHAVKEGLHDLDLTSSRALAPVSSDSTDITRRLEDIADLLRREFKAVSEEAKENVAANGRDTEQVLDATKDGLESLRVAIESYVDRATGVAGQEEFLDDMLKSLDDFKAEISGLITQSSGESRDQLQVGLEGLRDVVNSSMIPAAPPQANNAEVMEALNTGFNNMRQEILRPRAETSEILDALNDGLNDLRAGIDRVTNKPTDLTANDEILDALKTGLESVRTDIDSLRGGNDRALTTLDAAPSMSSDLLESLRDGLEAVRRDIEGLREGNQSSVAASQVSSSDELFDSLKSGLDAIRSDIEELRESNEKASSLEQADSDEILVALKEGLDCVRSDIEALRETNNEKTVAAVVDQTANDEILDALKAGLEAVRSDIGELKENNSEKAVASIDAVPNDAILHALKAGLESLRSDIETLRDATDERALAAVSKDDTQAVVPTDMVKLDDIKNLEVLITQLGIKVDAMDPETDSIIQKEDVARIEEMIEKVQASVDEISLREPVAAPSTEAKPESTVGGDVASKDDVEAIETILRNTKARLDDLMDGEQAVRKDHVDVLETLLLETRESMNGVTAGLESVSRKEELSNIETLISQLQAGVDEIKEQAVKEMENPERVSKTDVEAVETIVLEIKTALDGEIKPALDGLAGNALDNLAKKDDISSLEAIVKEFQEKLDASVESSTKAVEVRNEEMTGVGERVTEVKIFLEEFQGTIKTKLEEGSTGVESISKLLETMGEKMDKNENVGTDLKEMMETMKSEFEDSKTVVAGVKLESNEKLEEATTSLGTKIDEKIDELIAKYDEVQKMLDDKSSVSEARDITMEEAVVGSKAVADELKLLIDTLGSTVTDSMEKMEEASKTVFTKVEELVTKNDENHTEGKNEHQQTRDHVAQALTAVEGLKGEVGDYQPKILEAVKDVLLLVGEHFEHSKTSSTELQDKIVESKPPEELKMLLPPEKYDNTEVHEKLDKLVEQKYDDSAVREQLQKLMDLKYDDTELRERLDRLVEQKYDDTEVQDKLALVLAQKYDDAEVRERLDKLIQDKYDDSEVRERLTLLLEQRYDDTRVHDKLDRLVENNTNAEEAFARLESLDKVHASVVKTAADISEFLSAQTQRIADEHEDHEKTLQDTTLAVERKLAEKDHVEASILSLRDEEERLRQSVTNLRTEQESLIRQKTRLTGDVSSLETALRLRKDDLYDMESRAEHLERRILEGVMDHSRVLLMSKASKSGDAMSRKRVKKPTINENGSGQTTPKPAVSMALAARRSLAPPAQNGAARRIVSLSQINNNVASTGFKRSQSVRTPAGRGKAYRKRSWGGDLDTNFEQDKENLGMDEMVEEEADENDVPSVHPGSELPGDDTTVLDSSVNGEGSHDSDHDTLRRSSRGTVVTNSTDMYTDGYSEYSDTASEWTESAVGRQSMGESEVEAEGNELVVFGP